MDSRTPAELYQDLFWELVHSSKRATRAEDFLWEELRKATSDEPGDRLGRNILAAGLLAYGHLELAEVILDTIPARPRQGVGGKAAYLGSNAIRALLPLPAELKGRGGWYSQVEVAKVREWLRHHRMELQWDDEAGRFVLASPGTV